MSEIREQKAALRREMRARLRALSAAERAEESGRLAALVASRPEWQEAGGVMLYAPMPEELDVWPLAARALAEGRRLGLPRFDVGRGEYEVAEVRDLEGEVGQGSFGIREPSAECGVFPMNQLDLILVPGLAFGREGSRLGRGKGYYDRLLIARRGMAYGVALDWQVVSALPVEPHDQYVDGIVTPSHWLAGVRRS